MGSAQMPLFPEAEPGPTLRDVADAVREAGIEGLPDAVERADRARYQDVHVRSALARAQGMPFRWALNPYRGCTHACEYCYARKYQQHLELGAGDDFSSVILVKRNIAEALRREVRRPGWTRETVAVGTATDPYQPIEGHYRLTRASLGVLADAATPFSIVTKGPMVVRDLDVLTRATAGAGCKVFLSIPTVEPRAWSSLEPGTAPPAQRLKAARALIDHGVEAAVLMMPLVPGISTSRTAIDTTVRAIADAGVPLAGWCVARLDPGVRDHFFAYLDTAFPALTEGYARLYRGSRVDAAYAEAVSDRVHRAAVEAGLRRNDEGGAARSRAAR